MIPKCIHYCWFGGAEKPKLAVECIESWKRYCSEYRIIEWNEKNFDVNLNLYTKMCYESKKWAFLSDYVRLWVVYNYGGIYFDTDVELINPPDELLENVAFFGYEENKPNGIIASGLGFGSEAKGQAVQAILAEYEPLIDGQHGTIGCPQLNTNALVKLGLDPDGTYQKFSWGSVYPPEYFNPYDSSTGKLNRTDNTISIHWYMGSFLTKKQRIRAAITRPLHRLFGTDCLQFLKRK